MISDALRRTAPFQLDPIDTQRFSDAVSTSLNVVTRPQFFSWLQSSVQGVVPHEILVCAIRENVGKPMALHHFASTRYFREANFRAVSDPRTGLVPIALAAAKGRRGATLICLPEAGGTAPDGPDGDLWRLVVAEEMKNAAVHTVNGIGGQVEAIYAFARVGPVPSDRLRGFVEIISPHLHRAFLRVRAVEREPTPMVDDEEAVVTRRQVQILNLVKAGKTNAEIAEALGCSQWTVKNHVQAILRRLDSSSRAHAITRAISLGILSAD